MVSTSPGFSPGTPGFSAVRSSSESNTLWQSFFLGDVAYDPLPVINSAAVDSGNTPTSLLRPGLVMAKLDADGTWVDYDPTATDGSQEARGILVQEVNLLDFTSGSAAARMANALVILGKAKASALLNLDQQAKTQLAMRGFTFDDDVWTRGPVRRTMPKTADYTVTAADHATKFTTAGASGAVIFTLPAIACGLMYEFKNLVDQNMTVASAEGDNVIVDNDTSADSVAFSTTSHKIGGHVRFRAVYVSSTLKWEVEVLSPSTCTITTAT